MIQHIYGASISRWAVSRPKCTRTCASPCPPGRHTHATAGTKITSGADFAASLMNISIAIVIGLRLGFVVIRSLQRLQASMLPTLERRMSTY